MRTPHQQALRHRGWHLVPSTALLALLLAVCVVPVSAAAAHVRSRQAGRARLVLGHYGYRHIDVRCASRADRERCNWTATRAHARCSGRLLLTGHAGRAAIEQRRCERVGSEEGVRFPKAIGSKTSSTGTSKGASPPSAAPSQPPLLGFNTYTSSRTITEQKEVGARVSRLFVDWALVEPTAGQWNWTQTDSEYAQMVAGGLKPVIVAFTAPCWARPSTSCSNDAYTGPPDSAYDQDWTTFIHDLVERYPDAAAIEVWNEPNLSTSFLPQPNPARYTQLLEEAYATIKAVNPSMPVISGGLLLSPPVAGSGAVSGGYGADQFLAAMYADGAARYMDAVGIHIYPSDYVNGAPASWDPNAMKTWLSELNAVRSANRESAQPVWITEMGVSTTTQAGWPAAATPAQQASDLSAMSQIAQTDAGVRAVIIQGLEDQSAGYDDPYNAENAGWGIFTSSGAPKPSACAVSVAWHGSMSCS